MKTGKLGKMIQDWSWRLRFEKVEIACIRLSLIMFNNIIGEIKCNGSIERYN